VEVAPGYARNYLIPQGMGANVTPGILKQVERRREIQRQRLAEEKQKAEGIKAILQQSKQFAIAKQVGENEAIFGTVTTQDVADVIQGATGQVIDRRGITLPEINKLGTYQAELKLHPEVTAIVTIEVVPNE